MKKHRFFIYPDGNSKAESEITPVTVNSDKSISFTVHGTAKPGKYTQRVFNGIETHEFDGSVIFEWSPKPGEYSGDCNLFLLIQSFAD